MEDKQFDEASVEKVAKALHALGFITPLPSSAEVSELWDKSSLSYKGIHRIDAKYLLSSLSETHAIVPLDEAEQLERDVVDLTAECIHIKAMLNVATDIIAASSEQFCPAGKWPRPKGWVRPHSCRGMDREKTPIDVCGECIRNYLDAKAKEASPHA